MCNDVCKVKNVGQSGSWWMPLNIVLIMIMIIGCLSQVDKLKAKEEPETVVIRFAMRQVIPGHPKVYVITDSKTGREFIATEDGGICPIPEKGRSNE